MSILGVLTQLEVSNDFSFIVEIIFVSLVVRPLAWKY